MDYVDEIAAEIFTRVSAQRVLKGTGGKADAHSDAEAAYVCATALVGVMEAHQRTRPKKVVI